MATAAGQIVDVVTPAAGESVTEGTILEWHVKVGDPIKASDTIVEISTDKVDLELPAPASGVVSEILIEEGETVTVGQVIARISLNGGAAPAADGNGARADASASERGTAVADAPQAETASAPASAPPAADVPDGAAAPATGDGAGAADAQRAPAAEGSKISPVAARAAAAEGIDTSR